jgi:Response regulator of the LytR/AlgR family
MDAPIRTLIVDDEPTAREVLARYVERHATLDAAGTCESAVEAANILRKKDIDLLLLDVEMPEMSGLELVKAVEDSPAVILVTASETYAVEAFGLGVVDYLVKPVRYARFLKAITRVENQHLEQSGSAESSGSSKENAPAVSSQEDANQSGSETLFFQEEGDLIQIRLMEVQYVEAKGDYMLIWTESGKHMVNTTMKKIESKFPSDRFARVHRSYLVRLDQIEKIEDDTLLLRDTRVPIGPTTGRDSWRRSRPCRDFAPVF